MLWLSNFLSSNGPLLVQGALLTIQLWLCTVLVSLGLGILFGILKARRVWIAGISPIIAMATFIARSVPYYVQLLIVYFVLPDFFGINLSTFTAGVISLGFCSSGYVSEIVRAGINAIPDGQWEASKVLGFTKYNQLRYIIMPQMVCTMLPAFVNEIESILKSTSIIASIGALELTRMGMNIVSREMNPLPVYLSIACIYLFFSMALAGVLSCIERKIGHPKS